MDVFDMFIKQILGKNGVIVLIGIMIFFVAYRNSVQLFAFIEKQTLGTKDYILEKLELLFIDVDPNKITIALLALSFGQACLFIAVFSLLGYWKLGILLGVIFGFIGWKFPKPFINFLVDRRIKKYQGQLVDALTLLANGLRAGLSLPQAVGMVVDELPPPISQEFNLVLQENRIGAPLEECFNNLLKRVPTEDNEMFVTSVNVLRETGGNLSETFETIISVIRERIRISQKIDTYVAQGKMQATIVGLMPVAMAVLYTLSETESMIKVFTHPVGIFIVILAAALDFVGIYVINKIISIKL